MEQNTNHNSRIINKDIDNQKPLYKLETRNYSDYFYFFLIFLIMLFLKINVFVCIGVLFITFLLSFLDQNSLFYLFQDSIVIKTVFSKRFTFKYSQLTKVVLSSKLTRYRRAIRFYYLDENNRELFCKVILPTRVLTDKFIKILKEKNVTVFYKESYSNDYQKL